MCSVGPHLWRGEGGGNEGLSVILSREAVARKSFLITLLAAGSEKRTG